MDKQNAQNRVLTLVELVKAVLLQAEMTPVELLIARGINKTFNNVILHELPFRRILFLEAETTRTELETDSTKIEINPFLEKILPKSARHFFARAASRRYVRDRLIREGWNCKYWGRASRVGLGDLMDEQLSLHLPRLEMYDEEDYFNAPLWDEHAIWRRMYATRPVLPVHVVDDERYRQGNHRWQFEPATTLGDVLPMLFIGDSVISTMGEQSRYRDSWRRVLKARLDWDWETKTNLAQQEGGDTIRT